MLGDALRVEQRLDRGSCGVGVPRGTHDGLHDGPVEDHDQLIGQPLRILGAAALGLAGEIIAQTQLVIARDPPGRMPGVGQLGGRVDEWAAAESGRRRPAAKPVEDRQDLLAGRRAVVVSRQVHAEYGRAPRLEALGDELILAAELLVERALGDPGGLAHQVDADSSDALPVEQVSRGVQQPLARGRRGHVAHNPEPTFRSSARKQAGVPYRRYTGLFTWRNHADVWPPDQGETMTGQLSVLVTGASSGIGRAAATEFARRGHRVFAAARREEVLADLAASTPNVHAVTLDVTDADSVRSAWAKIKADTGGAGVDVLVNNAGFALSGPVEILADADVRRQFGTNVFGLLTMTRTVLPAMRARGSGRIINISSLVGLTTFPGMGVYGATKYAVEALSDALRQEVAGFGIKVVIIEPGFVATSLGEAGDSRGGAAGAVPDAYASMVAAGAKYLARQIANGIAPARVAAAIANAAEHRNPRLRYVVPASARPLLALLTSLPGRLADRAKQRALNAS